MISVSKTCSTSALSHHARPVEIGWSMYLFGEEERAVATMADGRISQALAGLPGRW